jgi:hypothetical protein
VRVEDCLCENNFSRVGVDVEVVKMKM